MATKRQFDALLARYGKAWAALDPAAVMRLIDPNDITYYESTFNEPTNNWWKVKELWDVVPANQRNVSFWYEILLHDEQKVLAHVKVARTMVPSGEKQDIDAAFLFGLSDRGLINYFRQWRMSR